MGAFGAIPPSLSPRARARERGGSRGSSGTLPLSVVLGLCLGIGVYDDGASRAR